MEKEGRNSKAENSWEPEDNNQIWCQIPTR
jgi:hypothetical protein